MKKKVLLALALAAVVIPAACSSDKTATPSTSQTPPDNKVGIVLREYSLTPDGTLTGLPAGEITFTVSNEGTINHEFVLVKSDLAADKLPVDTAKSLVDEDKVDSLGEIEEFAKGTTETKAFTMAPGSYVGFCNVAGHYQAGMHVAMTVA